MDEKKLREYLARADITDQRKIAIVRLAAEMGVRLEPGDGTVDGGMVVTDPTRPKRAMDIVRALAACAEPRDSEYYVCWLCLHNVFGSETDHESDCPWRQALEWVRS